MKNLLVLLSLVVSFPALACETSICVGDRVIYEDGDALYVGTAVEIYKNGKVKMNLDLFGNIGYWSSLDKLGKGVPCYENICVNDRAHYFARKGLEYSVTVKEVFDNGKIKIDLGLNGSYYTTPKKLSIAY